ncbi:MAG: hypothetical protein AAGD10_19220 [Myxococcota bacterium]
MKGFLASVLVALASIACGGDTTPLSSGGDPDQDASPDPNGPLPSEFIFVLEPPSPFFVVELDLPSDKYEWANERMALIDVTIRAFDFQIRDVRDDELVPILSAEGDCRPAGPDSVSATAFVLQNDCSVVLDYTPESTTVEGARLEVAMKGPATAAVIEADGAGWSKRCRLDEEFRSRRCRWNDPSKTVLLRARGTDRYTQFVEFRPPSGLSGPGTLACATTNRDFVALDIGALRMQHEGPLEVGCEAVFDCTLEAELSRVALRFEGPSGLASVVFDPDELREPRCERLFAGPTRCRKWYTLEASDFLLTASLQSTGETFSPTSYRTDRGEFNLAARHPGPARWVAIEFSHCGRAYELTVQLAR